ncbi:MAG: ATPase [Myxococcales bacterium FL481]|nr:MAG: ATPase [Myxococcales bacterium FL481]
MHLEKRIHVACAVETAFTTFTVQIDTWWPPGHRKSVDSQLILEPFVGGRFLEIGPDGDEFVLGTVRAWEFPRRVCYSWRPGSPAAPTEVEVCFVAEGDGTSVQVSHRPGPTSNDDAFGAAVQRFERGWAIVLAAFDTACRR